ncbi:MAG: hypothetical protein HFI77_14090 [Lachnospiraceae bacterium]|nr:hypothetical protein [Lachnospiraceae bacterium]
MSKLFIIGNGFDSAHCLATSYDEFRKYLCDIYMDGKRGEDCMPMVPTVTMGPKGENICDMEEVAKFLVYLISMAEPDGSKWSDLEASLGRLDYDEAFDMLPEELDDDGDIDYWREVYNNEDIASNLYFVVSYVKELFAEWVNDIDVEIAEKKQGFLSLIEPEDIFLTFNYTETLEKLYGINKESVCHIHGKQGENILFGHGNTEDYTDEYMRKNIGSENLLSELDNLLIKDTKQAMKRHKLFFDGIDDRIKEVYSIGFSFAEVDLIYVKEICRKLSVDVVWHLNDFNPSDIPIFKIKLKECGFKGRLTTFSV